MKKILLGLLFTSSIYNGYAQCDSAVATGFTLQCSGGTGNRCAIAYNPLKQVYYSADAGSSSYPLETFDAMGNSDTIATAGIDIRGMWWNSNKDSLESSTISNSGIYTLNLNPTNGFAKGGGASYLSTSQGMGQSCGTYDADSNEIAFYSNGNIYRFNRATGTLKYTTAITGVSTSNLNSEFIGYTGIVGKEYLVYDYSIQAVYFLNRDGKYVKQSMLPANSVSNSGFRTSYSNNLFWLFDGTSRIWTSYDLSGKFATVFANVDTLTVNVISGASVTYQWLDCSGITPVAINGATNQKYTPSASGSYSVVVTTSTCTDTSGCISFTYVSPTAVTSAFTSTDLTVYPNPNSGTFTISLPSPNAHVMIYNATGASVKEVQIVGQQYTININSEPSGIYYLVVDSDKGKVTRKIVVK